MKIPHHELLPIAPLSDADPQDPVARIGMTRYEYFFGLAMHALILERRELDEYIDECQRHGDRRRLPRWQYASHLASRYAEAAVGHATGSLYDGWPEADDADESAT